jgi:hypothetical protein
MSELSGNDPYGIDALGQAKTVPEAVPAVAAQIRLLLAPGQVTELRALKVRRGSGRPHTEAGFFDAEHITEMAEKALEVTRHAQGVYFTLNPLKPDLLARRANRIDWAEEGELAKDTDVLCRRWMLIDVDPVRDRLISATAEEKKLAEETMLAVREHLRGRDWSEPIAADSGNGFHLLYRIDLPTDDAGMVKRMLQALAARFDTDRVHIDQIVFNPARICKLPGSLARKGDHTKERPHRRARILEAPAS